MFEIRCPGCNRIIVCRDVGDGRIVASCPQCKKAFRIEDKGAGPFEEQVASEASLLSESEEEEKETEANLIKGR